MSAWLVETLAATALLMALVLLVRPLVRRAFGAGAAYALWLVPASRLVLPPLDAASPIASPISEPIEVVFASASAGSAGIPFLAIWALGAALFAGWHLFAYARFVGHVDNASPGDVVATGAVDGPAAIGLLKPRILVPLDFATRFDAAERTLVLRHERVHLERGDLWANAAALFMLALHWFNPLAHWAYRAFREDQEYSCDAAVIARAGAETRAAYAAAMMKSAAGAHWATRTAPTTTCPMTRPQTLKRRLKMVAKHKSSKLASAGGLFALTATALAGLTLTATNGIAQAPIAGTKTVVIKRLNGTGLATDAALADVKARCGPEVTESLTKEISRIEGKPVQVKIVECGDAKATPGDRLTKLERARANIAASPDVEDAVRGQILASLDGQIAALKAAR